MFFQCTCILSYTVHRIWQHNLCASTDYWCISNKATIAQHMKFTDHSTESPLQKNCVVLNYTCTIITSYPFEQIIVRPQLLTHLFSCWWYTASWHCQRSLWIQLVHGSTATLTMLWHNLSSDACIKNCYQFVLYNNRKLKHSSIDFWKMWKNLNFF